MKTIAVIGARLNSSRLPKKHLKPLAGTPLIERVVERLARCQTIDETIVATTADTDNEALVQWARGRVNCFAYDGDVNDLMSRIDAVIKTARPSYLVYICGDCPLIDPDFIDHGVRALQQSEAESIRLRGDIESLHEGIAFYSVTGWDKLNAMSTELLTREHIGYAERLKPSLNTLEISDTQNYSKVSHRISVDTVADYEFMNRVYEIWYAEQPITSIVSLLWVQDMLMANPSLAKINQHVVQKKPDKYYQKVALLCHADERVGMGHLKRMSATALVLQERLGLGTVIHCCGRQKTLTGIKTSIVWYATEDDLGNKIHNDHSQVWILDFNPRYCTLKQLQQWCVQKRQQSDNIVIALDQLKELLEYIDELFIPSFFTRLHHAKVNVGWNNYFLPSFPQKKRKRRITVLTGGADTLAYGEHLPALISEICKESYEYLWVQGPYADPPKIHDKKHWHVAVSPNNLPELLAESEIVVTTYGLSLYEAIASLAFTMLLPPNELCSNQELDALDSQQLCLISRDMAAFNNHLGKIYSGELDTTRYRENARETFKHTDGARHICARVEHFLTLKN